MVLMESCTEAELLDPALPPNDLLYRLFHEDGVRVFTPLVLRQGCRCSRERVAQILSTLPRAEVEEEYMVDGKVWMTCEFCNTTYTFTKNDLAEIFAPHAEH